MNSNDDDQQVYFLCGWPTIEVEENFKNMKKLIQMSIRLTQFLFLLIIVSVSVGYVMRLLLLIILQFIICGLWMYYFKAAVTSNQSICGGCTRLKASEFCLWLNTILFLADAVTSLLGLVVGTDVIAAAIRFVISCGQFSLSVALILNVRRLSKVYSQLGNNDEAGQSMTPVGGEVDC